jgi:hypothetical protein
VSPDVLIFSTRQVGGVRVVAERVRALAMRPVLVSDLVEDRGSAFCDAHVVVNWDGDATSVVRAIDAAGVMPAGLVNFVEPLIGHQCDLLKHYRLGGAPAALRVFASKLAVRRAMAEAALSSLHFTGGPLGGLTANEVGTFPAVVKPSRDSGASRGVHRADDPATFDAAVAALREQLPDDTEMVVEDFLDGVESSLDGPVLDGVFHPVLHVEKNDHDDVRLHDAGMLTTPPTTRRARAAGPVIADLVGGLCRRLQVDGVWLHVEARTAADGTTEIIEINPRVGGRLYRSTTRHVTGVDPIDTAVRLAVPRLSRKPPRFERRPGVCGMLVFEATRLGRVEFAVDLTAVTSLPGVVDAYLVDGYRVTTLDQENNVAEVLIEGADLAELRSIERRVREVVRFEVR